MKRLIITTALVCATASVFAQGTIQFNGRSTGNVVARVYGASEPNQVRGNTASDFPAGTQTYGGALLTGSGYSAQLWAGVLGTAEGELAAVTGSLTSFRTGGFAGFWAPPTGAVAIPGVAEGGMATLQVRAWDNKGGTLTSWADALADQTVAVGSSALFTSPALGGLSPAPVLLGATSFNLYAVPEPSTFVLAGLGAAALLVLRRRK
jgi:hypothetical protein